MSLARPILILLMAAAPVLAEPVLTIRLVEASNKGQGVGPGLGDVGPLLQNNLRFNSFRLINSGSLPLPAGGNVSLGQDLAARCVGDPRNLSVTILRGSKVVLKSTVELQRGTPFIMGGLPAEGGKLIVVLIVR
jgi:hypothetical protein